jgi:hypothetical protein
MNLREAAKQVGMPAKTRFDDEGGTARWEKEHGHQGASSICRSQEKAEAAGWKPFDSGSSNSPDGNVVAWDTVLISPDGRWLLRAHSKYGVTAYENSFSMSIVPAQIRGLEQCQATIGIFANSENQAICRDLKQIQHLKGITVLERVEPNAKAPRWKTFKMTALDTVNNRVVNLVNERALDGETACTLCYKRNLRKTHLDNFTATVSGNRRPAHILRRAQVEGPEGIVISGEDSALTLRHIRKDAERPNGENTLEKWADIILKGGGETAEVAAEVERVVDTMIEEGSAPKAGEMAKLVPVAEWGNTPSANEAISTGQTTRPGR